MLSFTSNAFSIAFWILVLRVVFSARAFWGIWCTVVLWLVLVGACGPGWGILDGFVGCNPTAISVKLISRLPGNSQTKPVILDIKFCFTCGELDLY